MRRERLGGWTEACRREKEEPGGSQFYVQSCVESLLRRQLGIYSQQVQLRVSVDGKCLGGQTLSSMEGFLLNRPYSC